MKSITEFSNVEHRISLVKLHQICSLFQVWFIILWLPINWKVLMCKFFVGTPTTIDMQCYCGIISNRISHWGGFIKLHFVVVWLTKKKEKKIGQLINIASAASLPLSFCFWASFWFLTQFKKMAKKTHDHCDLNASDEKTSSMQRNRWSNLAWSWKTCFFFQCALRSEKVFLFFCCCCFCPYKCKCYWSACRATCSFFHSFLLSSSRRFHFHWQHRIRIHWLQWTDMSHASIFIIYCHNFYGPPAMIFFLYWQNDVNNLLRFADKKSHFVR